MRAAVGVVAGLLVGGFFYGLYCVVSPFRPCWPCQHVTVAERRSCRHCRGTGLRLRRGRRVINYLRETRKAGQQ